MRIDAHQHFWLFNATEYDWIDESMSVLKRDFTPEDLRVELTNNQFNGSLVVQARQSLVETNWLIDLAQQNQHIKGVVGWIDLKDDDLEQQLIAYKNVNLVKGFRHVLQGEPDPNFMLDPKFVRGLRLLAKHEFKYDLLIYANQLPTAIKMLEQIPELNVVIDHIAKPDIKGKTGFKAWQQGMEELAQNPNTFCKISGMVTEADWSNWQTSDFEPYLETIFNLFGPNRVMYGSDWPVCLVAGSYGDIKSIVESYCLEYYPEYLDQVFGLNVVNFYQL